MRWYLHSVVEGGGWPRRSCAAHWRSSTRVGAPSRSYPLIVRAHKLEERAQREVTCRIRRVTQDYLVPIMGIVPGRARGHGVATVCWIIGPKHHIGFDHLDIRRVERDIELRFTIHRMRPFN